MAYILDANKDDKYISVETMTEVYNYAKTHRRRPVTVNKRCTGNGGTTAMMRMAVELNLKLVLIEPNQAVAYDKGKSLVKDARFSNTRVRVYGGREEVVSKEGSGLAGEILIFVIDSFNRVAQEVLHGTDLCCLDESHKLVTDFAFRNSAQVFPFVLEKRLDGVPRIFMSATPLHVKYGDETDIEIITEGNEVGLEVLYDKYGYDGDLIMRQLREGRNITLFTPDDIMFRHALTIVKEYADDVGERLGAILSAEVGASILQNEILSIEDQDSYSAVFSDFDSSKRVILVSNAGIEGWDDLRDDVILHVPVRSGTDHNEMTAIEFEQLLGRARNGVAETYIYSSLGEQTARLNGVEYIFKKKYQKRGKRKYAMTTALLAEALRVANIYDDMVLDTKDDMVYEVFKRPVANKFWKKDVVGKMLRYKGTHSSTPLSCAAILQYALYYHRFGDYLERRVPHDNIVYTDDKAVSVKQGGAHHLWDYTDEVLEYFPDAAEIVNARKKGIKPFAEDNKVSGTLRRAELKKIMGRFALSNVRRKPVMAGINVTMKTPQHYPYWGCNYRGAVDPRLEGLFSVHDVRWIDKLYRGDINIWVFLEGDCGKDGRSYLQKTRDKAAMFRRVFVDGGYAVLGVGNEDTAYIERMCDALDLFIDILPALLEEVRAAQWDRLHRKFLPERAKKRERLKKLKASRNKLAKTVSKPGLPRSLAREVNSKVKSQDKEIEALATTIEVENREWFKKTINSPEHAVVACMDVLGLRDMFSNRNGFRYYNVLTDGGTELAMALVKVINDGCVKRGMPKLLRYYDLQQIHYRLLYYFTGMGDYIAGVDDVYTFDKAMTKADREEAKVVANTIPNSFNKAGLRSMTKDSVRSFFRRIINTMVAVLRVKREDAKRICEVMRKLNGSGAWHHIACAVEAGILREITKRARPDSNARLHDATLLFNPRESGFEMPVTPVKFTTEIDGEFMGSFIDAHIVPSDCDKIGEGISVSIKVCSGAKTRVMVKSDPSVRVNRKVIDHGEEINIF